MPRRQMMLPGFMGKKNMFILRRTCQAKNEPEATVAHHALPSMQYTVAPSGSKQGRAHENIKVINPARVGVAGQS